MLPCGTGIIKKYCFCPFLSYTIFFFKSGIDKSTEWSTISACPSLMCFFNRGNTERTISSKNLCLTFAYVLLYVNLCRTDFVFFVVVVVEFVV